MNERRLIIQLVVLLLGIILLAKLFSIQVTNNSFKRAAENNIVQPVVEYPYRGLIMDRNGQLLVYNTPVIDLMVIPREIDVRDTALFCEITQMTKEKFVEKIREAQQYSYVKPSIFKARIPMEEFSMMEDRLNRFKGFYPNARTIRAYESSIAANALGYVAEVDRQNIDQDTTGFYKMGDYIGKSGVERKYEEYLRGVKGVTYKMVNVRGIEKGSFRNGELDTAAVPGENLTTTIDLDLQKYTRYLMEGKVGSAVAIDPNTGEILSMVSSPTYDPSLLTGRDYSKNFASLVQDSLKPLYNRPLMATYPPGSIFKTVQALIALEEGVIWPEQIINIESYQIGDHAPPGPYNVMKAIKYSSNNYFFRVFRRLINQNLDDNTFIDSRLGYEKWRNNVLKFGIGRPLGVDLPSENSGLVPTVDYYNRFYGENSWKFSTISSLSIGQDALLMTPIQMANLGACLANRGYYYTPHIVKDIGGRGKPEKYTTPNQTGIDSLYFNIVIDAMSEAIYGTAWRAVIPGIEVCGKTGTAENPHGEDHSVFMCFAPKENPQIAVSVYVENAGWGGRAAASIASLMVEYYIKGEVERPWLEDYVVKGDFADPEVTETEEVEEVIEIDNTEAALGTE